MATRIDKLGSVLIYAHHVLIINVGLFGWVEAPSPSVTSVIGGRAAATIWSSMFVLFGLLALIARIANRVGWTWRGVKHRLDTTRTEAWCLALIGLALAMFSALIIGSNLFVEQVTIPPDDRLPGNPGSIQTALALLANGVFLPGAAAISLAQTRRARLEASHNTGQVLDGVAQEVRRTTREA